MPKKLLGLIGLFILAAGLLVSLNFAGKKQDIRKKVSGSGSGSVLTIKPANINAVPGNLITVDINIDTKEDTISAAELHLTYDPTALSGISITPGDFLPTQIVTGRNINGNADIILGAKIEYDSSGNANPTPRKGTDTLVTLTFTAIKASTTQIDFAASTKIVAIGVSGNSISSMAGSRINILPSTKSLTPTFSPK